VTSPATDEENRVPHADFPTIARHYGGSEVSAKVPVVLEEAGVPRDTGKWLGLGMEGTGQRDMNVAMWPATFLLQRKGRGRRS